MSISLLLFVFLIFIYCQFNDTSYFATVSEHSLVLKEVKVPLWPHGKCQSALRRSFGANYVLPKTNICAGEEGNDACDVSCFICCYFPFVKQSLFFRETEVGHWFVRRMAHGTKSALCPLESAVVAKTLQVI